eukprot:349649-Pleurochrysis_carterae.AAC.2
MRARTHAALVDGPRLVGVALGFLELPPRVAYVGVGGLHLRGEREALARGLGLAAAHLKDPMRLHQSHVVRTRVAAALEERARASLVGRACFQLRQREP